MGQLGRLARSITRPPLATDSIQRRHAGDHDTSGSPHRVDTTALVGLYGARSLKERAPETSLCNSLRTTIPLEQASEIDRGGRCGPAAVPKFLPNSAGSRKMLRTRSEERSVVGSAARNWPDRLILLQFWGQIKLVVAVMGGHLKTSILGTHPRAGAAWRPVPQKTSAPSPCTLLTPRRSCCANPPSTPSVALRSIQIVSASPHPEPAKPALAPLTHPSWP